MKTIETAITGHKIVSSKEGHPGRLGCIEVRPTMELS
jgi:hypothetical protein